MFVIIYVCYCFVCFSIKIYFEVLYFSQLFSYFTNITMLSSKYFEKKTFFFATSFRVIYFTKDLEKQEFVSQTFFDALV